MESKKVILITGASKGIGKAIAESLGTDHRLVLFARNSSLLEEIAKNIQNKGGEVFAISGDVTRESDVKNTVQKIIDKYGTIDVLINNAGIGKFNRVDKITTEDFEEVYKVNVLGTFFFTKYVSPIMIKKMSGQIINIASVAGLNGFKGGTAYASSKFAVVGFTESLREDLKQYGIAVTAVCPGGVLTTFGGRDVEQKASQDYLLLPEDVARTIRYLVEESETANTKLIELKPRRRKEFRG